MQACLTKFFKNLGTDKPNYEYLFQKEEADRKKREEEERQRRAEIERRQAEEEERLYALYLERKERISVSRRKRSEEKRAAREAQNKSYCEGVQITKGVFLGNRLAALNSEWLCDNGITHVMNVTKDIQNYYLDERYPEDNDNAHPTSHALVEEPEDESVDNNNNEGDDAQVDDKDNKEEVSPTEVKSDHEQPDKAEEGTRIRYRRFAIEDSRDEELPFEEIEAAVRFVQSAHMGSEGRALIHCREGKSRSVTILLSYLMIAKRWPLQRAFNHVKERAPWINVNEGFLKLLMDIEVRLFNTNSIDFFDKQERKERIDYCEIDFEEEIDRSRRRTSTRSKKTSTTQENASETKESVKLESASTASVNTSTASSAVTESVTPAVKEELPDVPAVSTEAEVAHTTSIDVITTVESTNTTANTVTAVPEVTPVNVVASTSEVTPVSVATTASTEQPVTQASTEELEDKENGGDVQNVNSSVLGKRKREKPESKESPAKKKKKVTNLPEPKVNIMSFFKRIE